MVLFSRGKPTLIQYFFSALSIVIIVGVISIPFQIINSGHADKYKVLVSLNDGTQFTEYTTKQAYDNYLRHDDLQLTKRVVKNELIYCVQQIYNPYGNKEVNLPIH
jgi:hypothetical protein